MKKLILLVGLTIIITLSTCKDNPVKSENSSPVIFSLSVFPDVIGPSDSAIVICNAMDPDGDTLVYDWITDARLRIQGAFADDHWLFHTYENSRIFYPTQYAIDTVWVQCFVRDVKGGEVGKLITFVVKQNFGGD